MVVEGGGEDEAEAETEGEGEGEGEDEGGGDDESELRSEVMVLCSYAGVHNHLLVYTHSYT